MIKALAHLCILSRNLDRTLEFYCGILGARKKFDFIRDGRLFGFYLEIGPGQFIEVFRKEEDSNGEVTNPPIVHLCLETDDIDMVRTTLLRRGIDVTDKKMGADRSWQVWCKDPDGVPIEIQQYTAESSQHTGEPCVVDW